MLYPDCYKRLSIAGLALIQSRGDGDRQERRAQIQISQAGHPGFIIL
jgi:hypothetical protein